MPKEIGFHPLTRSKQLLKELLPDEVGEEAHRVRLLTVAGLIFAAAGILLTVVQLTISALPSFPPAPRPDLLIDVSAVLIGGLTLWLAQSGRVRLAAWMVLGCLLTIAVVQLYLEGNPLNDIAGAISLLMVVAVAAAVLSPRQAWLAFGIAAACFVVIHLLWLEGYLPQPIPRDRSVQVLFSIFSWLVSAGIIAAVTTSTSTALRHHAQTLEHRIADLEQAQASLTRERDLLHTLMDNTPDWIFFKDAASRFTRINQAHATVLGVADPEEAVGKTDFDFFPEEDARRFYAEEQAIIQSGEPILGRVGPAPTQDGKTRWRSETKVPLTEDSGEVTGLVGISRDVTELKRAQEKIMRQLERLAALREIDRAITASTDLSVSLNVLLEQVTNVLHTDAAAVLLFDPHLHTLEFAAGRGFRTDALRHIHLRLDEGYAGRAARERRTVSIPDLTEADAACKRSSLLLEEDFVAYHAAPLTAKGEIKGVLEVFHHTPLDPQPEWLNFLEALSAQAAIAIDNAQLFADLQRSNTELTLAYDTTLEGWARALELRDRETEGHTRRVADMTLQLARAMGMRDEELVHVRRGALLHDIGKMGIPDSILLKPDELTDEEWDVMHQHPVYAHNLLSPIEFLRPALDIPYCHHERWDGSGYPRGLQGEEIPLAARVFAVVDVYDALTSDRPYRDAWPEEEALAHICDEAGRHFDPRVVEVFFEMLENKSGARA